MGGDLSRKPFTGLPGVRVLRQHVHPFRLEHGASLAEEAKELEEILQQIEHSPERTRKTLSNQVYRNRKGGKAF